MHACGPWANARCERALGRETSNVSGSGNVAGSRLAAVSDTMTRSPRAILAPAQLGVGGRVAVDARRRRLEPQRFLDRVRRPATGRRARRPAGPGVVSRCQNRRRGHALAGLDAAEHHDRGVRHDLVGVSVAVASASTPSPVSIGRADVAGQRTHRRPRGRADLARRPRPGRPRRRSRRTSRGRTLGSVSREAERGRDDVDGQRSGQVAPDLGTAGGCQRLDEPARLGLDAARRSDSVTSGLRKARANGSRWRRCSSPSSDSMLGPDDLGGREARIVDGEARGVAHDLDAQVAARDQPAAEHGHPRHRLARPAGVPARAYGSASSCSSVSAAPSGNRPLEPGHGVRRPPQNQRRRAGAARRPGRSPPACDRSSC